MIEQASGRSLALFFQQWFDRTGAPEFTLSWRQEGDRIAGIVRQPAPYYAASVEIRVDGASGETLTAMVEIAAAPETAFSLRSGFAARDVMLDPSYRILRWTPNYRALRATTHHS